MPHLRVNGADLHYESAGSGPETVVFSHGLQYATLLEAGPADRVLSYLPLAHALERALVETGSLVAGFQVFFAERPDTFLAFLAFMRPPAA